MINLNNAFCDPIEFELTGSYGLFTDPLSKLGGNKCSYPIITYESARAICKNIYWKPTFEWIVLSVRVINQISYQTLGIANNTNFNEKVQLMINTYLKDIKYQIRAVPVWNQYQTHLKKDRDPKKHIPIINRSLERGGRLPIYLGVTECPGHVKPTPFGNDKGYYDNIDMNFGNMFHGKDYPELTGKKGIKLRYCPVEMKKGVITFLPPEDIPKSQKKTLKGKENQTIHYFGI